MDNKPLKILEPQTKVGFSVVLFVRLVVLIPILFVSGFMIFSAVQSIRQGVKGEYFSLIPGIIFLFLSGALLLNIFVLNSRKLKQLQYLIYEDRLVIFNKKTNSELKNIPFQDFPECSFHENLNDFGYIVIGPEVPLIAKNRSVPWRWGVSMEDPQIMLENLPNVKKEYEFLKNTVEHYRLLNSHS